jgi:hypothetical protein
MEEHLDFPPTEQSFALWLFRAMGIRYTIWLPFFTVLAFVLALLAVMKFKPPYLTATLLAVVPLPIYIGAVGVIDGLVASFQVIALSGATPRSSDVADGAAMSLVTLQVGLILALPLYLMGTFALCYRAFRHAEAEPLPTEPPVGAVYAKVQ